MGFDIGAFFDDAKKQIGDQISKYEPVITAAAEQYGIEQLSTLKKQTQPKADAVVKELVNSPSAPAGSFAAALSGTIKSSMLTAKGPELMIAIAAIGVVGFLLLRGSK